MKPAPIQRTVLVCALLLVSCLNAGAVHAQESWYQVEVIVFEQQSFLPTTENVRPEQFPSDIQLSWPQNLIRLNSLEIESTPPDTIAEPLTGSSPGAHGSGQFSLSQFEIPVDLTEIAASATGIPDLEPDPPFIAPFRSEFGTPKPFYQLERSQLELSWQANTLNRNGRYPVLWHAAWIQPTRDSDEAPWIEITGGEAYDDRYRLEGSARLYQSRFLHFQLDLWLTEFGLTESHFSLTNTLPEFVEAPLACDWLPENWGAAQVPANSDRDYYGCILPPDPEAIEVWDEMIGDEDLFRVDSQFSQFPQQPDSDPLGEETATTAETPLPLIEDSDTDAVGQGTELTTLLNESELETGELPPGLNFSGNDSGLQPFSRFLPQEIIKFEDSRRITSRELHYFDHPRMGVLVKITPVAIDEPDPLPPDAAVRSGQSDPAAPSASATALPNQSIGEGQQSSQGVSD